ncbi:ferredoxin [Actinoplanes sp. NPDC026623]|uniref:ferredoxin n=1 Tax=Actinoplanes sp. NPDC026623 TaxID=3155610 RepID=UPI0033CD788E
MSGATMRLRVELDEPRCVAAGQCAMIAPDLFDQRDEDGVSVVLDAEPAPGHHDAAREAASACPAAAIRLVRR